jgi:hypothetical protein
MGTRLRAGSRPEGRLWRTAASQESEDRHFRTGDVSTATPQGHGAGRHAIANRLPITSLRTMVLREKVC